MWGLDDTPPAPGEPLEVSPGVHLLLAPNANSWTFEGTNTWILTGGGGDAVVVDPGPDDPAHLDAIDAVVRAAGARVREVLLTHHHGDHSEAARPVAQRWDSPIRPRVQRGIVPEGARFDVGSIEAWSMHTPGHTSDGLSLVLPRERLVLTGDTVIARVNSFIGHPDGTLADMLRSMDRIAGVVDDDWLLLPGHGPFVREPRRYLGDRSADRLRRVRQVAEHAGEGRSVEDIVARVHPHLDGTRQRAAHASVEAILHYLHEQPAHRS